MKTLGLDLGTSSIGWALVESNGNHVELIDKGVHVFEKGVGEEKGSEVSRAAERSSFRAARRIKMRRKWRKQQTLRVLCSFGFCPGLTEEEIDQWRFNKVYPSSPDFRSWLQTCEVTLDGKPAGPYYFRWLAATQKLDLSASENRFLLGRAFYHLAQRRGYKSNRISGEDKDGAVAGAIKALEENMQGRTLGQYYYEDCLGKEPVRGTQHYTSRKNYEDEFAAICALQEIPPELRKELHKAIFFQRPLKSQKGSVGKCALEPKKPRAPASHPLFERYRALQSLNHIRVTEPRTAEARPLNATERAIAQKWLLSRSNAESFDKLARKLTPSKAKIEYGGKEREDERTWLFNYRADMKLAPCKTLARFESLFGQDWQDELMRRYTKADGKTPDQVIDDVWHALFSYADEAKLQEYGETRLGLSPEEAVRFAKPLPQGYANLSLCAIRKIVPFLEKGLIYSHAVFMANLPTILKNYIDSWESEEPAVLALVGEILDGHHQDVAVEKGITEILHRYKEDRQALEAMKTSPATQQQFTEEISRCLETQLGSRAWDEIPLEQRDALIQSVGKGVEQNVWRNNDHVKVKTIKDRICAALAEKYRINGENLEKVYHPSAIETYPKVEDATDGRLRLGSPRIEAIKNPVFMRTMHQLRSVVNALLDEGMIDQDTRIRIEMARDLNTANQRAAIYRYQRELERQRAKYRTEMEEAGYHPTESDVLKYQLWEEQHHKCLYTNANIALSQFLGDNPVFDIEHTIPRSKRLDNSQANLTLCDSDFNRRVKRNRLPSELPDAEDIQAQAKALWEPEIAQLESLVEKRKATGRAAGDKAAKDKARQEFHYYQHKLRYLRAKLRNFMIEEPPDGFTNAQLVDTRIICKYSVQYLKSLFERVYPLKAGVVNGVKEIWGLDDKTRENHVHHGIDAVITACLTPRFYEELAQYYHAYERYELTDAPKPHPPEPWEGFAEYLNCRIDKEVLVVHQAADNLLKPTFKKLRIRGRIERNAHGQPTLQRGNSARGALHKESVYGMVLEPPQAGNDQPGELFCVIRKKLADVKDFSTIVDPAIRRIVEKNKALVENGETVWFDEAAGIPIKKVRVRCSHVKPETIITLKAHRDVSRQEHKRHQYVDNAGNHITALYRGTVNGKPKADWKVVSNIKAVKAQRTGTWDQVLPEVDDKGLQMRHILKSGTQVLFYRKSPEELRNTSSIVLARRLYKVTQMAGRRIVFDHNACAVAPNKLGHGVGAIDWNSDLHENRLRLSVNGINILVEGTDFKLNPLGHVTWLERDHA